MARGSYHETLAPWSSAAEAAVTLATTYKALIPAARYSELGTQFFDVEGRKLRITANGAITTAATPANGQMGVLFGTGADANGVNVAQTVAFALIASQANIEWDVDLVIKCVTKGATGTLFARGVLRMGQAVTTVAQPFFFPASAPAVSASCDLTGVLIPSLQFLRSGSTAETMTVWDYDITPMN